MFELEKILAYPSQITPYLYLSGIQSLDNPALFTDMKVTHVVSVVMHAPDITKIVPNVKQLVIAIHDSPDETISTHFQEVFAFIDEAKIKGSRVLIHCEQGMSRSASFVIAWLMYDHFQNNQLVSYDQTLAFLTEIRAAVSPNSGFTRQLKDYASTLNARLSGVQTRSMSSRGFFTKGAQTSSEKLAVEFPDLSESDKAILAGFGLTDSEVYGLCLEAKRAKLPQITPASLIGFSGNSAYLQKYLATTTAMENQADEISVILQSVVYSFKRTIIQDLFSKSFVQYKQQITASLQDALAVATKIDNIGFLQSVNSTFPSLNWRFVNTNGLNLLFIAAFNGSLNAFKFLLLDKRLNPNGACYGNTNLLGYLAFSNNEQLMKFIQVQCPRLDPLHENNTQRSAIDTAKSKNNTAFLDCFSMSNSQKSYPNNIRV